MRNIYKAIGTISTIIFCYRLIFYLRNNWFISPTFQGGIILLGSFGCALLALGIVFEQISTPKRIVDRLDILPGFIKRNRVKLGLLFIAILALASILIKQQSFLSNLFCGNPDIIGGFCLIIFLALFPELLKENSILYSIFSRISRFFSKYYIFILIITHILVKSVLIIPNAFALVFPVDAIQYFTLAKQFSQGYPDFVSYHHYPPLYSIALAPAFLLNLKEAIKTIAVINILLSSSSLIPIYLISRNYLNHSVASLITTVSALFPYQLVYPFFPASENLYYPLFFWIILILIRNPKPDRFRCFNSFILGLFIGFGYLTRFQTLPLLPVYIFCYWLKPGQTHPERLSIKPDKEKVYRIIWMLLGLVLPIATWFISGSLQGVSLQDLSGLSVEGEGTLMRINPEPLAFFIWSLITIAYFILIAGPVLGFLLSFHWEKTSKLDPQIKYWLVVFASVLVMLFITVFRHAWIASYNVDGPQKFLGRYCLYLGVLTWITTAILVETGDDISSKRFALFSLPTFALVFGAYELFHNRGWIFSHPIIHFIYIDGHISGFEGSLYFILMVILFLLSMIILFFKRKHLLSPVVLIIVAIINLISLPDFYSEILKLERPARFLAEIDTHVFSSLSPDQISESKYSIGFYDMFEAPEEHLFTRSIVDFPISFRTITKSEIAKSNRNYYLQMVENNMDEYLIIKGGDIQSTDIVLSKFGFNQEDFVLVQLPTQ
jgi:hypothetical protein